MINLAGSDKTPLHYQVGDTFGGLGFRFPFDLTGHTIKLEIFQAGTPAAIITFSDSDFTTIGNKKRIEKPAESLSTLQPSLTKYSYKISLTGAGKTRTYFKGPFLVIL
jgi:hypothetical protein